MSEIEKAREEQDAFRLREQAADARVIAAREKASAWSAKIEKAAEDRIREIAREEIEAAGAGAWVCGACGAVPSPTCPHRGVAPQCGVLVRASDFAIPGDPFNQEGGDANSPGRHERPATGLDKSPPAVEAPAAGALSPLGGITIRADEPNIVLEGFGRPDLSIGSELSDMTALARRLAEELSKIAGHVVVSETAIEALAEARKRGLIE